MIRRWGISRSRWRASIQETEKSDCSGNDSGIYNILKVTVNRILLMGLTIYDQWKKFNQRRWAFKTRLLYSGWGKYCESIYSGKEQNMAPGDPRQTGDPCRLSMNRAGQDTSHQVGVGSLPSPRQKGKVLGELSPRGNTRADLGKGTRLSCGPEDRTEKERAGLGTWDRGLDWLNSLPGKGRIGPRVGGGAKPACRGHVVHWQRGSSRV